MPTTSQVAVLSFQEIFQDLVNKDFEVLALLVSSKLSGTNQSAAQAKELMGAAGGKVHLADSQSVAMAIGFQALAVARALEGGASLKEAIALAEKSHAYKVSFLQWTHWNSCIRAGASAVHSAYRLRIDLKPILAIHDGRVEGVERIRTKSKAHDRVLELVVEKTKGKHRSVQPCTNAARMRRYCCKRSTTTQST